MIVEVPMGAKLFDTVVTITPAVAAEAKRQGFDGAIRYINLTSPREILDLRAAGLGVMFVTECRAAGWQPDGPMGATDGGHAALLMRNLGVTGVTIFHDIEGVAADASAVDVMDFHDAWASQQGLPGVYVGAGGILSGPEWYARKYTKHYWKGLSMVRDRFGAIVEPDPRGWGVVQLYDDIRQGAQKTILGVTVDVSFVQRDYKLDLPKWLAP